ncbi:MAG: cob(I)yrinic acid a,c-diamide adenosyltransferase [Candidatus Glassbacteria bacterium]|nr:cob(I)yrinic acid a,c-diamide adenosyltransferase [Candidatus Glassbacteria bacterium]
MKKGIAILATGHGKGKTTSALGQTFRALGHGWKVCFLQFVKGEWPTGEARSADKFADQLFFKSLGLGFTWKGEREEHLRAGREAFSFAAEKVVSDEFELVVLDELTWLVRYQMVTDLEVVELIEKRPRRLNLMITGRYATQAVIDACDIVSEIVPLKYPGDAPAARGIEY